MPTDMPFNLNPPPQSGTMSPFGLVPGPIGLPNPAGDLAAQYPNLAGTNAMLSQDILDKLGGVLSPATTAAIQRQYGGQGGVMSGMPGSGLNWNAVYGNLIGASEAQKQQGIQAYNATIPTVKQTQTVSPELQFMIALQNAINAAAPNPQMAQTYAQNLFNQYRNSVRSPAGGGYGQNLGQQQLDYISRLMNTPEAPARNVPAGFPDPSMMAANRGGVPAMTPEEADWLYATGFDPESLAGYSSAVSDYGNLGEGGSYGGSDLYASTSSDLGAFDPNYDPFWDMGFEY